MKPNQAVLILSSLYADETDPPEICHANQDDLFAYIEAELNHLPVATLYPELHAQLATCASCGTVYAELKALLTMEQRDEYATPPMAATFDFSYLAPRAEPVSARSGVPLAERIVDHVTWRLTELGQLIVSLSDEFIQSLQPAGQQPAFLKSTRGELFALSSPNIANDLNVAVTARPKRRDPDHCTITVSVDIPSRGGWPNLEGTAVTLSVGEKTVETRATDAFGKVVFDNIARDDLGQLAVAVATST